VPVFGFVPNVLPFPVSESYVLGLLVCVSGAVSCRVLSDGVHSLRYVSMRGDRIVWIVHVIRVVSCRVVSCRVHSYSYVLVRARIRAVVLIVLRYVTLRLDRTFVMFSCRVFVMFSCMFIRHSALARSV
jgi:hypothetical protein